MQAFVYSFFEYNCALAALASDNFSRAFFISSTGAFSFVKKRITIIPAKIIIGDIINMLRKDLFINKQAVIA